MKRVRQYMTMRFSIFWLTMVVTTVLPTRGDTVHVRNEALIDATISPFQTGEAGLYYIRPRAYEQFSDWSASRVGSWTERVA